MIEIPVLEDEDGAPLSDAVQSAVADVVRTAVVQALREAANAWTQGAWANTPRYADPAQDRLSSAQYAGDWLRSRATKIERREL